MDKPGNPTHVQSRHALGHDEACLTIVPWKQFLAAIAAVLGLNWPRLRLPQTPVRILAIIAHIVLGIPLTSQGVEAAVGTPERGEFAGVGQPPDIDTLLSPPHWRLDECNLPLRLESGREFGAPAHAH
jgi:hypothetical protein